MKSKVCLFCGKEFIPNSPKQNICKDDHYWPCPDCGKPVLIKASYNNFMKYSPNGRLCNECKKLHISNSFKNMTEEQKNSRRNKIKETCLKRYGVDNPLKSKEIRDKVKNTVRDKYGVDNISQSPLIQERIRENSIIKYGVSHPNSAPENIEKRKEGMIRKYGVDNAGKSIELRNKRIATNLDKYGFKWPVQSEDVKSKIRKTCLEHYGVEYALQSEEVREQIRNTCKQKYGLNFAPSKSFQEKFESDEKFKTAYLEFISSPREFINNNFNGLISLGKLHRFLNLDWTTVWSYCDKFELWDMVSREYSNMESEILDVLKNISEDIKIIHNDRKQIAPYELDFFLPDYNIAIECNPTFTHNSTIKPFTESEIISYKYHQMKSKLCEEKGIFLFHIFGYEWSNKKDVIISMLRNLLGQNEYKIYARNTQIKEVSGSEAIIFLNQNHRQGYTQSSIRLGLYYNDELISLMTFGKMRDTLGRKLNDYKNSLELVRFCNRLNTTVVGGASKLFKYFLEKYNPDNVISFSDRAHTKGTLYSLLGFKPISYSEPNYIWVDFNTDAFYTRSNCRKSNLRKLFNDDSIDIENLTEKQIMVSKGYVQVFDSGTIRWEYNAL